MYLFIYCLKIDINTKQNSDFDIDGEKVIYTCLVNGKDCSLLTNNVKVFEKETGKLNWTPSFNQAGPYNFVITANDTNNTGLGPNEGGFKEEVSEPKKFTLKVINVNRPPILDSISDSVIEEKNTFSYDFNTKNILETF